VETGSSSIRKPRGSETRQKNGQKTETRWTSPKGDNGGGVVAKCGEGTADSSALGCQMMAEEYEGVFGGFDSVETHVRKGTR
jgi:hypothetical protein